MASEYRIVVQRRTHEGKWRKVFAMHGSAETATEALMHAAKAKGRHPANGDRSSSEPSYRDLHGLVRYPNLTVEVTGTDDNVFSLISRVRHSLREAQVAPSEITEFRTQCGQRESGLQKLNMTYEHILAVSSRWVKLTRTPASS
jgi:hypothetical protein